MTVRTLGYLAEWLHLALENEDGVDRWQAHFDEVRVGWQLDEARGLLREAKRAALSQRGLAIVRYSEGMLYAQLGDWDQVTDAGLIYTGVIDFVYDAVAEGKPDPVAGLRAVPTPLLALEVQRGGMPGQPGASRIDSIIACTLKSNYCIASSEGNFQCWLRVFKCCQHRRQL